MLVSVFDWFIKGKDYITLRELLKSDLKPKLVELFKKPRIKNNKVTQKFDNGNPLFIMPDFDPNQIQLSYPSGNQNISSLDDTLPILDEDTGATMRFNTNIIGEIHPHGNLLALAASIISSFINENAIAPKVSPSVTTWEEKVIHWLWSMICDPEKPPKDCGGRIVSGGTVANLTAVFIARDKFRYWAKNQGYSRKFKPCILISPHLHYSMVKAARIAGFTQEQFRRVEAENVWLINGKDVRNEIKAARSRGFHPIMVSALSGATEHGYIDKLEEINNTIKEYNSSFDGVPPIYFHIDAAYGGPFIMLKNCKELFKGLAMADAITLDGHKMLYCNYPCGGILVRNKGDLDLLTEHAPYILASKRAKWERKLIDTLANEIDPKDRSSFRKMQNEFQMPGGKWTLEGSRGIHGITQLFITLKVLGKEGLSSLLQHTIEMTKYLRQEISKTQQINGTRPALELLTDGPLNATLFRFVSSWKDRSTRIEVDNKINYLIPDYLMFHSDNKIRHYYIGSDKLLHLPKNEEKATKLLKKFINNVWRLNGYENGCPDNDWESIHSWWIYSKQKELPLYVLKTIVMHPYTNNQTIKGLIQAVMLAGIQIKKILEKGDQI